mgnify:FL=1|tara:strand:- start:40 stop:1386 length:1347 start_codon:yes stop_codon:yes gene_type:complete
MDKELAQLEEWAVDLINNYEKELLITDPDASAHKRIKRFSGELVANPEAYAELLEMGRSKGMTGKQLVSAIRKIEQNLLDESSRGTSMSRKQLMSDVIHHFYAQRTGGDTLRRLGQADRQQARTALRDIFGRWGNVPENLKSMFRAGHLNSDILKGVEGLAAGDLGVTQAKELDLFKAHTTKGGAVTGTGEGITNWRDAVNHMAPQMDIQRTEGLRALQGLQPLMDKLDNLVGNVYTGLEDAAQLKIRRDLFTAKADDVRAAIREFYEPLVIKGGKVNLNAAGLGAGAGLISNPEAMGKLAAGDYMGAIEAAGTEMLVGTGVEMGVRALGPRAMAAAAPVLKGAGALGAATTIPEVTARVLTKGERGSGEVLAEAPGAAVAAGLGPVSPTLGQTAANAPVDPEAVAKREELERKAEEARQRGGRLSFNFGGAKFTLPEFGVSEMLEIN